MDIKLAKTIAFGLTLIIILLFIWYAISIFLLVFASILFAILLNVIGKVTKKITRLPYPYALLLAIIVLCGILSLIFWLYSPVISDQFELLTTQLPQSLETLKSKLQPYFGQILSQRRLQEQFSLSNQKFISHLLSVFSTTLGSIAGLVIFLIIGLYLAFDPNRYLNWLRSITPLKKQNKFDEIMGRLGHTLKWWLLGKLLSMTVVGVTTLIGLSLLHVNLAFILALLSGLLAFIPYVGAIISAVPAVIIGFAQSPLMGMYVIILYTGIHVIEGYFISPQIELRTVSIPPAVTIMAQSLMMVLVGAAGLALATPLVVVAIAVAHQFLKKQATI